MTCTDCRPLIVDYVHRQLDDVMDAGVFTHLHECAECMRSYREELALGEALRAAFSPERALPTSVIAGVRMAMHAEERPSLVAQLRAFLRPQLAVPLAVVLMIGGASVVRYDHTVNPPPQFSTNYYLREHVAQTMSSPSSDRAWSDYVLTSANSDAQTSR
jgi:predicted anti-sigma-YlaC factor YlaD